jgi:hypothetical protein
MMAKDPAAMAFTMLGFNEQDWRIFLSTLRSEMNAEDSDWEAALYYVGQRLRDGDFGGLEVVLATLRAGARSPRKREGA